MYKQKYDDLFLEIDKYRSLTPLGLAFEGFEIMNNINKLIDKYHLQEIRSTILSWI